MIFEIFVHNVNENRSGRELESSCVRLESFRVISMRLTAHKEMPMLLLTPSIPLKRLRP